MNDKAGIRDSLVAKAGYRRPTVDKMGIRGHGVAVVRGPDGEVKQRATFENLVTDRGDEFYAKMGAEATEDSVTGMRLGTGSTAAAKSGAGAAIGTYVSGSNKALDSSPATSDLGGGSGYRVTYVTTWGTGEATATGIEEVVITNETPLTDVAGAAGNTISRGVLGSAVNKGADDTLEVTWNHDLLGA